MVIAGSLTAVASVILGLFLAWQEDMTGLTLERHRYAGLLLGGLAVGLLYLTYCKKTQSRAFRFLLALTAVCTILTGHLGAMLTHGDTYLTELLPQDQRNTATLQTSAILTSEDEQKLAIEVRAILAHNCFKCHGEVKQKGNLRLDQKEFLLAGGKNGSVITPGNLDESELYRRITLPSSDKETMPSKGKLLTKSEIELIGLWIENGAFWPDDIEKETFFPTAELAPRNPTLPHGTFENPIDLWVNDYFLKNNISWNKKVNDQLFLRRVFLDITGLTPSYTEVRAFEQDNNPAKRKAIIEKLLNNNKAYAEHWLTFWNDALRNDYTGTGYITKGRFNINHWLYTSLFQNKPYNQFVKELLNPGEESKGFIEGIKWRGTVNASQRTEMQAAQNVGQVLLGLNLKCASCHDSFVSNWKLTDAYAFANIFAEERLEIARCEKPTGKFADTRLLWPELGVIDSSATRAEKLNQLANNLVQPANGRLYRTLVNRIWAQLMGRGIIGTVDEMDNPAWSQDLLDWLAVNFVDNQYDTKKLLFLIMSSDAYQLVSEPKVEPASISKNTYKFRGMLRRRLTAEQFTDAVSRIFSPVFSPDEIKYQPLLLAGYELLDTPVPRASLVANNSFLTALGRPNREIVTTSRPIESSLLQALELTNGTKLDSTLRRGASVWNSKFKNSENLIQSLYQEALNREPTASEMTIAQKSLGNNPSIEQIQDLLWAVLILPEFQLIY